MKLDYRIKIVAVLYILAVLILLGRSYKTNRKALTIIKDQFGLQQLYVAESIADRIREEMDGFVGGLELLDESYDVPDFSSDTSLKSFRNAMSKVLNVFNSPCVYDLALLDDTGKLRISVLRSHMEGTDYSSRPYFQRAKDAEKNDVIFEYNMGEGVHAGQNVQFIVKPLKSSNGDFSGVLCYMILFNKMVDSLMPYDLSGTKSCVVSKDGVILSKRSGIPYSGIDEADKKGVDLETLMKELEFGKTYRGDYVSKDGGKYAIVTVPIKSNDQIFSMVIATPERVFEKLLLPFSKEYAIHISIVIGILVGLTLVVIFIMSKWNLQLNKVIDTKTTALSEFEQKQKIILATINEVFWQTDADGRYKYISSGALSVYGFSPEELVQTSLFDLMSKESLDGFRKKLTLHEQNRRPFSNVERVIVCKDGKQLMLATNGIPLFDAEGNFEGFVGADRDITKRKNTEQKLMHYAEQLEQVRSNLEQKVEERTKELEAAHARLVRKERGAVLGQLSIAVSHELRNPLGVISNAIFYFNMKKDSLEDPVLRENIDIVSREIKTANKIITDILNFSRDSTPVRLESNINRLVQEILLKAMIPEEVRVVTEFDEDILPVAIDPTQVAQIFLNLLENAVNAMGQSGRIWVATMRNEKTIQVFFVDDGPGIAEKDLENIFEPLYTTRAKGIGLGLAIAKNLAEANNARISVRSREGEGAVFTVTFMLNNGEENRS